ncbi:MAG: HAMP domain-containing protein, partial [Burkholderiales bacterium]|nr:HAMP domain-containing protein [Burkholderiales bacterium]
MKIWQRCAAGFRRLSLKSVIVLGIAIGILAPALVVGPLLAMDNYRQVVDLRVNGMLAQYATMLQQSMVAPVWQVDAKGAQVFIDAVMLNPDVVAVQIDDAVLGKFAAAETPERRTGKILREERPILHEGAQIGRVKIEISTALVEQQLQHNLQKVGIALLLQLGTSFLLLFFLFERRLMRPLRQLRLDTQRLANNELVQPVTVMYPDEMGELAVGLDRMREKLGMHIEQIHQFNTSLEQRVHERTQALHLANEELQSARDTLKNEQEDIQRTDRLAAIGALVAGFAPELN